MDDDGKPNFCSFPYPFLEISPQTAAGEEEREAEDPAEAQHTQHAQRGAQHAQQPQGASASAQAAATSMTSSRPTLSHPRPYYMRLQRGLVSGTKGAG